MKFPRRCLRLFILVAGAAVLLSPDSRSWGQPPRAAAVAVPIRPDPKLTPGDTLDVTLEDIRTPGYSARVRDVPVAVKREVYAAYGITRHAKGEFEVDHLISLSLGGSNSKKNLWPQAYGTSPWNAHTKDALEYRLLTLVRAGKVDLKTAQQDMARDWIAAYKKYVDKQSPAGRAGRTRVTARGGVPNLDMDGDGRPDTDEEAPATVPAAPTQAQLGADARPDVTGAGSTPAAAIKSQVWVNTKSGVIWRPGSRYYGKTKTGKYMTEADAKAAGYRFAAGR